MSSSGSAGSESYAQPAKLPVSVLKTFKNKNVFLTGATGFVGKVILEKIMRSIPEVGTVYVLVRPRKNQNPQDRLREEILGSRIFATLREQFRVGQHPYQRIHQERQQAQGQDKVDLIGFEEWAGAKLVAVPGELTQPKLGMSEEVLQALIDNVHIVIHCAAVVDFNERLDRALELNTLGSLRMMELAHECKDVRAFVHVSTCYVNSNQPSGAWIDEKLYPLGFEPEALIEKVMKMPSSDLDSILSTGILRDWPNTYTFTKAMTEHLLVKKRGKIPLAIVRPSIVGCASAEPVPGWVDVISAAGAVFMAVGMGVVKFLPGSPMNIGDVIPVDYVSNSILVSVAAVYDQDRHLVCQAASSSENPLIWGNAVSVIKNFFTRYPPPRAISPVSFRFLRSPQMYQIAFFLQYSVPSTILNTLALAGAPGFSEKAQLFSKLLWQVRVIIEAFKHFVQNQWVYSNQNVRSIWQSLEPEERKVFDLDLSGIDWMRYCELFAYGLTNYTLKVSNQLSLPEGRDYRHINVAKEMPLTTTMSFTARLFPDSDAIANIISDRVSKKMYPVAPPASQLIEEVLNTKEVMDAINAEAEYLARRPQSKKTDAETPLEIVQNRAKSIAKGMFGQADDRVIGSLGLVLRKVWRRIYSGLNVAMDNLNEVKAAAAKGPVIYIPTHRSYMDFLIVSYVSLLLNLPIPFIAAGEDFLGIFFVRWLFRNSGAFFIRRSFANDKLYTVILQKYVEALLLRGQSLEFFIEGTRSRTGKMLQPKMGFISMLTSAVQRGVVEDLTIVPITINYEKTMESHMYANELSGQRKIKESLSALVRARSVLNARFGHTTVVFSKPFSLKEWMSAHMSEMNATNGYERLVSSLVSQRQLVQSVASSSPASAKKLQLDTTAVTEKTVTYNPIENIGHKRYMNRTLACNIVYDLSRGLECMPAQLVATLLLQYRQGITRNQLITKFDWLRQQIVERGGYVFGCEMESVDAVVDDSLSLLRDVLNSSHTAVYQPAIAARHEYNNMLVLGQYKNRLVDMFYREALWCVVLYSLAVRRTAVNPAMNGTFEEEQKNLSMSAATPAVSVEQAHAEVQFLHTMLQSDFVLKPNPDEPEDHLATFNYMVERGILQLAGPGCVEVAPTGETHFSFLCSILWPFVDSFYTVTLMLYSLQPCRSMKRDQLVTQAQWLGTTLHHESMLCFFEACSKETLDNACTVLKNLGILVPSAEKQRPDSAGSQSESVELAPYYQDEATLETLVERLSSLRKQPPVAKRMSRKTLIADIPILAKLSSNSKL